MAGATKAAKSTIAAKRVSRRGSGKRAARTSSATSSTPITVATRVADEHASSLQALADEIRATDEPARRRGRGYRGAAARAHDEHTESLKGIAAAIGTTDEPAPRRARSSHGAAIRAHDEHAASLKAIAATIRATDGSAPRSRRSRTAESVFDIVAPARPVAMELVGGRGHYERVLAAVMTAKVSVWIATANVKELMVEDHRARPGRRRSMKKAAYVSVLSQLDALAEKGVELRLLHAEIPSRPFREEIANHPRLLAGGLELRRCPRVHMKAVIVDGELLYLGSANWTGAGLGAKGSGRRNFELGFVTDDAQLLDQVQGLFEHLWNGGECGSCKLQDECPGPLVQISKRPQ